MASERRCGEEVECRLRDTIGCFEDVHHDYYPKRDYRTQIEKQFRELPENKQRMCRQQHNDIHATNGNPEKPSLEEMRLAILEHNMAQRAVIETMLGDAA